MKTGAAIAGMLAAAAIGAGATGWLMRSPTLQRPAAELTSDRAPTEAAAAVAGEAGVRADSQDSIEAAAAPAVVPPMAGVPVRSVAVASHPVASGNPLDSPDARMRGHALYLQMNCAGCHGYHGEGNMGPPLSDQFWLYGGTPAAIYRTLSLGRPKGMPAWGQALPPESLWQLVAYLQSMGGTVPPGMGERERQGDFPDRGAARGPGTGPGTSGQSPPTTSP